MSRLGIVAMKVAGISGRTGSDSMVRIPMTIAGDPENFALAVQEHVEALTNHMMGKPGMPAPRANELVELVISRQPQDGRPAERGPDRFVVLPYEIYDDRPVSEQVKLLRETVGR